MPIYILFRIIVKKHGYCLNGQLKPLEKNEEKTIQALLIIGLIIKHSLVIAIRPSNTEAGG